MNDFLNCQTKYAEYIYNHGFTISNHLLELDLLSLYMRDVLQFKPKRRKNELIKFCETYDSNFKLRKDYYLIKKSLNHSINKNNKLIDLDNINVYKEELDYINSLNISYNAKKVVFTLLVENKKSAVRYEVKHGEQYNNIVWKSCNKKCNYIKAISKIPQNHDINKIEFKELVDIGLIEDKHGGFCLLLFLNNIPECKTLVYNIVDFENIGWYFDLYNNKNNIKVCIDCNGLFKQTGNNQFYCKDCSIKRRMELERIRQYNLYHNK